jgi:hypothetical protein
MNKPRPAHSTSTSDARTTRGTETQRREGHGKQRALARQPGCLVMRVSLDSRPLVLSQSPLCASVPRVVDRFSVPRSHAVRRLRVQLPRILLHPQGVSAIMDYRWLEPVHTCTARTCRRRPPRPARSDPSLGDPPGDVPRVTARGGIQRRRTYKPRRLRRCSGKGGDPVIDRCTQGLRA